MLLFSMKQNITGCSEGGVAYDISVLDLRVETNEEFLERDVQPTTELDCLKLW